MVGATVVCSILHNPPTRRVGGAFCTTTICGVFPWWSRRALAAGPSVLPRAGTLLLLPIQLVEYFFVPRVEISILLIAAALSLGTLDCVSLVSRSCWS